MSNYLKFKDFINKHLLIVDVQKDFTKFFPPNYLNNINNLCKQMSKVYQIWDSNDANKPDYKFPNQVLSVDKKYGSDLDKNILTPKSLKELNKDFKDNFFYDSEYNPKIYHTNDGGFYIYIGMGNDGPGHQWFLVTPKLVNFFNTLKKDLNGNILYLAGGAERECLYDVEITLIHGFDIGYQKLDEYTYMA